MQVKIDGNRLRARAPDLLRALTVAFPYVEDALNRKTDARTEDIRQDVDMIRALLEDLTIDDG